VNESAGQKLWKRRAKSALGNRRSDFHFSHSFNNNKLDDRDHFQQNAKTSVASLRGLIGSSRNIDRHHSGMLIDFIGIPTATPLRSVTQWRTKSWRNLRPGLWDDRMRMRQRNAPSAREASVMKWGPQISRVQYRRCPRPYVV
jgi:hypothetical protein